MKIFSYFFINIIVLSICPWSQASCHYAFLKSQIAIKMEAKNANFQEIRFFVDKSKPDYLSLALYRKNKLIGGIQLTPSEDSKNKSIVMVDLSGIRRKESGKSIGTYMYLVAAKILFEETGDLLYSSFDTTSDGNNLWSSLVRNKFAEKTKVQLDGEEFFEYRFRKRYLKSKDADKLRQYFNANGKEDGLDGSYLYEALQGFI